MCIPFLQLFQRRRTVATTTGMSKVFVTLRRNSTKGGSYGERKGSLKKQPSMEKTNGKVAKTKGLLLRYDDVFIVRTRARS